jgi:hypothetical protein
MFAKLPERPEQQVGRPNREILFCEPTPETIFLHGRAAAATIAAPFTLGWIDIGAPSRSAMADKPANDAREKTRHNSNLAATHCRCAGERHLTLSQSDSIKPPTPSLRKRA